MEAGKCVKSPLGALIMCVLILGLFLIQTPVEARSCCKDTAGRICYEVCRRKSSINICLQKCDCTYITSFDIRLCPRSHPKLSGFLNSEEFEEQTNVEKAYQMNEYCKLGCVSSQCGDSITATTTQKSDEELEQCASACLEKCNKNFNVAAVTT